MEPDKKKKFNFGTGEIDVDQWLQDIDAGLNAYYSDIDKTYHKEEAQAVRNAMTNLIGRISNGDMMSRSANGMYNFKSQLYSPERGKYDKWAHQIALNYIGNKGRAILSSNTSEPKEKVATKPKYTPQTLTKRFNNSIQRGAVNLNLDNTWWGTATNDQRVEKLVDFLNKEAQYVRGSQDISDVGEMYGDLGREGLATAMETLASTMNTNRTADYSREFGNIGMNNILKKVVKQEAPERELTLDEQLELEKQKEENKKKAVQLGWYQNKKADAYYNKNYDIYHTAYNNEQARYDANKAKITDPAVRKYFMDSNAAVSTFLSHLKGSWENLFEPTSQGLQYKDTHGNALVYSPQKFWESMAKLFYQAENGKHEMQYIYDEEHQRPVKVGNNLFYIPGTYKQNGNILLMDTANKRLVRSSILNYPSLNDVIGRALYEKEGGVLKMETGGGFDPTDFINGVDSMQKADAQQQALANESLKNESGGGSNPTQGGQAIPVRTHFSRGDKIKLLGLMTDLLAFGTSFGHGKALNKFSRWASVGGGALNFAGDLSNYASAEGRKRPGASGWFMYDLGDLAMRTYGAMPWANKGVAGRAVMTRFSSTFSQYGRTLTPFFLAAASNPASGVTTLKKLVKRQFSEMSQDEWMLAATALEAAISGKTVSTHVQKARAADKAVTHYRVPGEDGKTKTITAEEYRNSQGRHLRGLFPGDKSVNGTPVRTKQGIVENTQGRASGNFKWVSPVQAYTHPNRLSNNSIRWFNNHSHSEPGYTAPYNPTTKRYEVDPTKIIYGPVKSPTNKNSEYSNRFWEPWDMEYAPKPAEETPGGTVTVKKNGGALNFIRKIRGYQAGGKTGIKPGTAYNWYNNVFTGYKQHILDGLKTPGYADWLNSMQGQHSNLHREAGTNYDATAYSSDNVGNYQTSYQKGFEAYDQDTNPYNKSGIGQAYKVDKHYDFGTTKRDAAEVDWENGGQFIGKPDKLYSQMTDDRRILGRKGDWTPEALAEFNKSPQMQAAKLVLELDPNDEYYKLKPINEGSEIPQDQAKDQETERTVDAVPQSELKKPFDPRALLIMGRGATNILANDWMFDRMLDRQPLWYSKDFIDRKLDTIGDYAALASAGNQAADLRTIQQLRQGSDQSLNIAADFEAGRIGREVQDKARLQDANKQAATHEAAIQVDMKDLEDNRDTAFINRKLMHDYLQDRFDLYNAKDKARVDSITGVVNNLTSLRAGKYLEEKAAYEEAKKNIMQTPREYAIDQMQRNNPELYKKVADATASSAELAQYNQLLSDYLKEGRRQYSADYFSLYGGRVKEGKKLHGEKEPKANIKMNLAPIKPATLPTKVEQIKKLRTPGLRNLDVNHLDHIDLNLV